MNLDRTTEQSSGAIRGASRVRLPAMRGPGTGARRRGRGEGSIYKDEAKGRWYAAVSIGYGAGWEDMAASKDLRPHESRGRREAKRTPGRTRLRRAAHAGLHRPAGRG